MQLRAHQPASAAIENLNEKRHREISVWKNCAAVGTARIEPLRWRDVVVGVTLRSRQSEDRQPRGYIPRVLLADGNPLRSGQSPMFEIIYAVDLPYREYGLNKHG